jgi:hypothetical protein
MSTTSTSRLPTRLSLQQVTSATVDFPSMGSTVSSSAMAGRGSILVHLSSIYKSQSLPLPPSITSATITSFSAEDLADSVPATPSATTDSASLPAP